LLLNVVQSAELRQPACDPLAALHAHTPLVIVIGAVAEAPVILLQASAVIQDGLLYVLVL
jgi:Sec-independent protein secretion pathway component TatC